MRILAPAEFLYSFLIVLFGVLGGNSPKWPSRGIPSKCPGFVCSPLKSRPTELEANCTTADLKVFCLSGNQIEHSLLVDLA